MAKYNFKIFEFGDKTDKRFINIISLFPQFVAKFKDLKKNFSPYFIFVSKRAFLHRK